MDATPQPPATPQRKQRAKEMAMGLLAGAFVLSAIILVIIGLYFQPKTVEDFVSGSSQIDPLLKNIEQRTASAARAVVIPRSFFESETLKFFIPYTPIEIPPVWGRQNPFVQFSPEDLIFEEEEDEDLSETEEELEESVFLQ